MRRLALIIRRYQDIVRPVLSTPYIDVTATPQHLLTTARSTMLDQDVSGLEPAHHADGVTIVPEDKKPKERIPVDTAWFKGVIADRRTSQRQIAIRMGIDPAAMSLMLNGMRKMGVAEASELAEILGQPIEEVIARAGGMRHMVGTIRTPSQIAAVGGARLHVRDQDSDTVLRHLQATSGAVDVAGWVDGLGEVYLGAAAGPRAVERPLGVPAGAVALRLQSQDMWDGWLVFYKPAVRVTSEAVGQMCVVEREDGRTQLRFVQRGYEAGKWNIGGERWPREENVVIRTAAPVLWMKQR